MILLSMLNRYIYIYTYTYIQIYSIYIYIYYIYWLTATSSSSFTRTCVGFICCEDSKPPKKRPSFASVDLVGYLYQAWPGCEHVLRSLGKIPKMDRNWMFECQLWGWTRSQFSRVFTVHAISVANLGKWISRPYVWGSMWKSGVLHIFIKNPYESQMLHGIFLEYVCQHISHK